MSHIRPLTEIKRQAPEAVLASLLDTTPGNSKSAGLRLAREAASFGVSVRDYLTLAIDPRLSQAEDRRRYEGLHGYEATLAYLSLPLRNDFAEGVTLQLASQTFQTYDGTRLLFPEVVDDMVRMNYRMTSYETTTPLVANSRTISGTELISTVVNNEGDGTTDNFRTSTVSELGRIPTRTIRTSQSTVRIWKFGSGYETSYEFTRRASLDLLTPYAARVARELEISKVSAAVLTMLNGDGVNAASTVKKQSDYGGTQTGSIQYKPLLKWLVDRAKSGTPVDTVIGNWDAYVEWLLLFAAPQVAALGVGNELDPTTAAQRLAMSGFQLGGVPLLQGSVNFALASAMTPGQLLGITKAETVEELIEANSSIAESEQAIVNQSITYVRTQNAGYKLVFGDTRQVYDYTN